MATLVLRNLAHDLVWALLALAASVAIFGSSMSSWAGDLVFWSETGGFLAVTVVPSVILWSAFGLRGLKSRVPLALCCQTLVTTISMATFYLVNVSSGLMGRESQVMVMGFGVFAGLKMLEFMYAKFRRAFLGVGKRVLVVGDGLMAELMEEYIRSSKGRYVMLGRVKCPSSLESDASLDDELSESKSGRLLRLAQNFMADQVVVSLRERRGVFPVEELLNCKLAGIEVVDAPTFYERATHKMLIENITPSWFIFSHGFKVTWLLRLCKRTLDITASFLGLMVFLPLIPFIILAIKFDSPGPILFKQVRVGQGDKRFTLMKFRSMRQDAESRTGAVWSQENDPRITRVGNFLRRSRLDEIPQLVNILKGDMSVVGPRPERPEFVGELKKRIPYYSERHYVKPGLTGWAQVCYPYGSSVEDAIEKLRYDLYYIKNISILLDFYIILKTFGVVLLGKGR
ncbi:MAG: TIGR03013 family PEP-CTERM/XrtA system glycosyltransferase [Desulfomicrobium sp.]|nr:TIGR03013 family PEP-CTERM/XrtA system glycosyltransferase [Desulfomicrobium sp.]